MGIFNEQSNHSFARGIQGAPGVGFSLTADGNYMLKRKLTNQTKHQINPMLIQQQQIQ